MAIGILMSGIWLGFAIGLALGAFLGVMITLAAT